MQINRYYIQSPTEVTTLHLGIPQEYKKQCIKEAYRLGDSQNQKTNVKGIMSSYKVWNETNMFNQLLDNIKIAIDKCNPPFEYSLDEAWVAIYKKGHYTVPHHHLPNDKSFVYYLQSSGNTPLIFDGCDFKINPIDDMLIIFPSYLWHSVPKHTKEEDRICVAGNLGLYNKPNN